MTCTSPGVGSYWGLRAPQGLLLKCCRLSSSPPQPTPAATCQNFLYGTGPQEPWEGWARPGAWGGDSAGLGPRAEPQSAAHGPALGVGSMAGACRGQITALLWPSPVLSLPQDPRGSMETGWEPRGQGALIASARQRTLPSAPGQSSWRRLGFGAVMVQGQAWGRAPVLWAGTSAEHIAALPQPHAVTARETLGS